MKMNVTTVSTTTIAIDESMFNAIWKLDEADFVLQYEGLRCTSRCIDDSTGEFSNQIEVVNAEFVSEQITALFTHPDSDVTEHKEALDALKEIVDYILSRNIDTEWYIEAE